MIKSKLILIVISLTTLCCHEARFEIKDLPSKELVDSVVTCAIESSDFTVIKYSKLQLDSLVDHDSWRPFFNLNSHLAEWKTDKSMDHQLKEESKESTKHFSFEYLKTRLFQQDSLALFNSLDSSFMIYQIKNKYRYTLDLKSIRNVSYVNNKEIETQLNLLKHNDKIRYSYCQISKPLFNKDRTIAVVGMSIYDYHLKNHYEGGVLMIFKRKENSWVFLTDIDWWGH